MKLKLSLARGKDATATEEEPNSDNSKKERKEKKKKDSSKKEKKNKEKKESKKKNKKDKDEKTEDGAKSKKKSLSSITFKNEELSSLADQAESPHVALSPRAGYAVTKWEQALKEEKEDNWRKSASADSTPTRLSNHQRPASPATTHGTMRGTATEAESEERRKRRQQRALQSYNDRPRVPSSRRAFEAGVGVGPAEAINRHLRGGGEEGPWLLGAPGLVPRGEAEGLEVEADDNWYDQLKSSDDEYEIDPEQLLLNLAAASGQEPAEESEEQQESES